MRRKPAAAINPANAYKQTLAPTTLRRATWGQSCDQCAKGVAPEAFLLIFWQEPAQLDGGEPLT